MKEGKDFLLKGTSKILRVSDPTTISPFVLPTTKSLLQETPLLGAIPHKAVTSRFSSNRGKQLQRLQGSFFRPHNRGRGCGGWSPPFFQQRLANKQLFIQRIKTYHQWLHTAIPLKAQLGQFFSDNIRIQGPPKGPSLGPLHPVSTVKECYRKGGKCKISRVLQSPVSSTQASPKVEASYRLTQAQHFLHVEKL